MTLKFGKSTELPCLVPIQLPTEFNCDLVEWQVCCKNIPSYLVSYSELLAKLFHTVVFSFPNCWVDTFPGHSWVVVMLSHSQVCDWQPWFEVLQWLNNLLSSKTIIDSTCSRENVFQNHKFGLSGSFLSLMHFI